MSRRGALVLLVISLLVAAFLPTAVFAQDVPFSGKSDNVPSFTQPIPVKHLYELIHLCIWERGYDRLVDFNSDGSVNSTDLMILNRAVLGLGGLPVPIEIGDYRID